VLLDQRARLGDRDWPRLGGGDVESAVLHSGKDIGTD
jgi:hypothetical protein